MHCRAVTYFTALAAVLSHSAGELITAPRSIESKVGDTTYFNCSTNLDSKEIFWHHGLKYIYIGEMILDPYRGRFEIDRNASNGSHNLVIHSVKLIDAGVYTCIDDDGSGTKRSAELVVLENDPDCTSNVQPDGVIGQNVFNIPPDEVQLTCNVTYYGNIPPQMEWKKIGDNSSSNDGATSQIRYDNHLIYTLKLKGDVALDNSSYICQTTRSTQNQYKCTSEIIRILYFFERNTTLQNVFRGEKITCTASNNTFHCNSQWYRGDYTCPLSCEETITTHLLGEYLCTLKCHVRGTDYPVDVTKFVVVEATTAVPPSTSGKIAAAVVTPIIIIIIILVVLIVVLVVRYKKNKKDQSIEKAEQIECLLANVAFVNSVELETRNVAEEEVELLYKMKKEDTIKEKAILGVAILGEQLFTVRENSSELQVYDCANFNLEILTVKDVVAAVDICSCKINNCLYIMDKKNVGTPKEIVKLGTDGALLGNWSLKNNVSGYVSTTEEGNVIITVQDKQMLLEYSSEGNLVRVIKLPECINPWHAIKVENDRYIVSHGTLIDRFNRVCLVDKKGKVEKSFGKEIGSTEDRLNMPFYLAVGSNKCVMVADLRNNRVLLLDSTLKFKTKPVPKYKQGFRNPRRIYLDDKRLVVVIAAGDPKTAIPVETGNSREGSEEEDTSTEKDDPLRNTGTRKMKEVEASQLITEDCRLLVFDIQLLLQKFNA